MKNNNIKTFVAVGIGAALFFVLGRFVAIPSPVPNTNISLQYAVLGLLAAMYGPVAGGLIGFIGHALIDLSWGGIPWWSWVIASAFTGVVVGLFAKKLNLQEGDFNKGKVITYTISNVIAHLIAWIVVAPVLDILIYAEPVKKVFAQGAFAAISNIITAVVVGGLLVLAYTKTIAKIQAAIEAAYKEGEAKLKGNGKSVPALSVLKTPLRDGDAERPDDEAYKNAYFVNANATSAPGIVDADLNPILTRSEVYSGVYGRASITFYAFNSSGNKGIACGLNNLQKIRDGEPLGGKASAESDFATEDDEDFLN